MKRRGESSFSFFASMNRVGGLCPKKIVSPRSDAPTAPTALRSTTLAVLACTLACFDLSSIDESFLPADHVEEWRDQVIYQLMVDRFANGDSSNDTNVDTSKPAAFHGGDWQGVIDQIPYLKELGVTAVWISPVVRNVEEDAGVYGYHGYWTQSFVDPNPHFGDLAKLREMNNALHAAGIAVILDIVTNHVGQLFYYDINRSGIPDVNISGSGTNSALTRVTEYDPDFDPTGVQAYTSLGYSGPAPAIWFYEPEKFRVPPSPAGFANLEWYHRKGRVTSWTVPEQVELGDFPGGLKDLATERPDVRRALIDAFGRWIEIADFDGFRIDTLKHVEHGFWQEFCPAMRQKAAALGKKRFLLFGEVFDGDDQKLGSYTRPGEVDSVFYFSQKFQVYDDVFKYGQPTKKIEDLVAERRRNYEAAPQPGGIGVSPQDSLVGFLDNHDVPRFLYDKPSVPALHSALFHLLTWDGIPNLYYGTEQEFHGGNDPANREDLWLSGYKTDGATFQHIATLIKLRKKYAPLRRGTLAIQWSTTRTGNAQDAGLLAFERTYEGKTILVVVNAADKPSETSASSVGGGAMQTSFPAGSRLVNVFPDPDTRDEYLVGASGALTVTVAGRGGKILLPEADR